MENNEIATEILSESTNEFSLDLVYLFLTSTYLFVPNKSDLSY